MTFCHSFLLLCVTKIIINFPWMMHCCLVTLLNIYFSNGKCSFTQAEIHKMTSHCYCVNFISAST